MPIVIGSDAGQDHFVLEHTGFRRCLSYLEIGAGSPIYGNNTYVLEKEYDWTGFSMEVNPEWVDVWTAERVNPLKIVDALSFDYDSLEQRHFTYLSCDIEPPRNTFEALVRVIGSGISFDVITFEHDYYTDIDPDIKSLSRNYLQNAGYELARKDVEAPYQGSLRWLRNEGIDTSLAEALGCAPFEDWYVRRKAIRRFP
jgi:hypothetical protein